MSTRIEELVARLRRGLKKTEATFSSIDLGQWDAVLYEEPYPWTVRDLLAHFVSAEEGLLRLAQDIAAGGPGVPDGFDYDAFNAAEQRRLTNLPPDRLLDELAAARQRTIRWVAGLSEVDLERAGRHPALGVITLENFVNAIYGHQLLHVRDLLRKLK
jgi:hypothetical protein